MSVRNTNRATAAQLMQGGTSPQLMQDLSAGMTEMATDESVKFNLQQPNDPLTRTLNVNIKGNLSDLTGNPSLSVWQPTVEALNTIFQQSKYHNLKGDMAKKGDLKSVILHSISVKAVQSDFPFAVGAKITGVDETTFTRTGKSFSTVFMPKESSHAHRVLQKDNVEVAYDFASRYPVRFAFKISNSDANPTSKFFVIPIYALFDGDVIRYKTPFSQFSLSSESMIDMSSTCNPESHT
jgi:hypothetical protein